MLLGPQLCRIHCSCSCVKHAAYGGESSFSFRATSIVRMMTLLFLLPGAWWSSVSTWKPGIDGDLGRENGDPWAAEVQCGAEVKFCVCEIMGMERESSGTGASSGALSTSSGWVDYWDSIHIKEMSNFLNTAMQLLTSPGPLSLVLYLGKYVMSVRVQILAQARDSACLGFAQVNS